MQKKIFCIFLTLCMLFGMFCIAPAASAAEAGNVVTVADGTPVVYVKASAAASGDGTSPDMAFQTMTEAYSALTAAGGTIVLCDGVTETGTKLGSYGYYAAPVCGGAVCITAKYDAYDFTATASLTIAEYVLRSDHLFENINIKNGLSAGGISALGNDLTIGEGVVCTGYSGGQYPMLHSGLFMAGKSAAYYFDGTKVVTTATADPIVTGDYQPLTKGTDGDGVQDIVVSGGTWRAIRGGNMRLNQTEQYGYLDHTLNITVNAGTTVQTQKDSHQSGALEGAYSSANGSANLTINGGTFKDCGIYLFGRTHTLLNAEVKPIEGNHSLTVNGGTFAGYCLIAGAQATAGASSTTSLPTDMSSTLLASGTCTVTLTGGDFSETSAVKTTATDDVTDVFTAAGSGLHLVVSAAMAETLGEQLDISAFSSRTDYDTGEEYCTAHGHVYTATVNGFVCGNCGTVREKTELTLRSLAKDGDTWSYAFAQSIPDDEEVTLDFTNVTVTKDGDEWIASGFTLSGADKKYYTLATERMAFVPADSDLVTVTVDGSVIGKYYRGTEVVVTAPAKDGYNFDGWYRDGAAVCTDAVYTFTAQSDVALTTQYTQKAPAPAPEENGGNANAVLVLALACKNNQKCVVTYKSTGAVDHVTIAVKKGTTIAAPAIPQKDGYTFVGWYKDINGTKPFDFTAKITRSVSIYAKWVKN